MPLKVIKFLLVVFSVSLLTVLQGQTKLDSINSMMEEMLTSNRLVTALTGLEMIECPVGVIRTSQNVNYAVAISQIKLTKTGSYVCDVYLRIEIGNQPPEKRFIFFGV